MKSIKKERKKLSCGCKIVKYINEDGALITETDYCTKHGAELHR